MPFTEVIILAVSMAMDAFAVCLAAGALPDTRGPRPSFRLSFHFGLFQFLMPVLGWLAGTTMERFIRDIDHWIAFGLLAAVGVRMIYSAWKREGDGTVDPSRGWTLVLLSIAVSIDALAVGLSLGLLGISVWYPALVIGVVTSALALVGLQIGSSAGPNTGGIFRVVGGFLLIGIGLKILAEHLALV